QLDLDAVEDLSPKKDQILDNTLEVKNKDGPVRDVHLANFEPWATKRSQILNARSSDDTPRIIALGASLPAKFSVANKTKYRLQMLEDMSGLRKLADRSQKEFVNRVNELRQRFLIAWENNKRVESIEVITTLARLLSAPTTPSFFPIQWILVTDIIDLFGDNVYGRLLSKANEERKERGDGPLPSNFESTVVPPNTVEVAQNWFSKVDDIKEVVPRFYVETTLIGCQQFLDSTSLRASLLRLATMIEEQFHIFPVFITLSIYARVTSVKTAMIFGASSDETESVTPALEWIVQCVSYGAATIEDLGPLWEYCRKPEKHSSLIHAFVIGVSLKYLLNHCAEFCELFGVAIHFTLRKGRLHEVWGRYGIVEQCGHLCQSITPETISDECRQLSSIELLTHLLSVLVFVPDIPKKPMLHMFNAVINLIERLVSEDFVLTIAGVVQYIRVKYRTTVAEKVDHVMQQVLALIEAQSAAKPAIAMNLLEFAVMRLSIEGSVVKMVTNLLKRCAKSGQFASRVAYVIEDLTKLSEDNDELKQALIKMKLL
ncbi:hypothetical protein COOONC_15821, partial [Cooperia oncophora]